MKIQSQHHPAFHKLSELIKEMPVAMLTTIGDGGDMESRPMAPREMDSDGVFWFFVDRHSDMVRHLDRVNLSFTDTNRSSYVAITGHGSLSRNREHIHRLWTASAKPWFPDGPDSPHLALLKFTPTSAEHWDMPQGRAVRLFAIAVSILESKPVGAGEHRSLAWL
jgi:general stress protein 26